MSAQFLPGDVGYSGQQPELYKALKVKTQVEKQYAGEDNAFTAISTKHEFSEDGRLTRSIYDPDLNAEEAVDTVFYIYSYRPDGNVSTLKIYGIDEEAIIYSYTYDKKGLCQQEDVLAAEQRQFTYIYDAQQQVIAKNGKGRITDPEGELVDSLQEIESYTYTWQNKHLVAENLTFLGEFYYFVEYKYDDKGRLSVQSYSYDAANPTVFSTVIHYVYDDKGLMKKRLFEYPDTGEKFESFFEYTYYN